MPLKIKGLWGPSARGEFEKQYQQTPLPCKAPRSSPKTTPSLTEGSPPMGTGVKARGKMESEPLVCVSLSLINPEFTKSRSWNVMVVLSCQDLGSRKMAKQAQREWGLLPDSKCTVIIFQPQCANYKAKPVTGKITSKQWFSIIGTLLLETQVPDLSLNSE